MGICDCTWPDDEVDEGEWKDDGLIGPPTPPLPWRPPPLPSMLPVVDALIALIAPATTAPVVDKLDLNELLERFSAAAWPTLHADTLAILQAIWET
mmetsp:Transcript_81821/g.162886  ORF Transcript_81821/g.162886 Transcript_81821/m.162886 type:complete len:96 (+) Transcript_81821:192-479(+)